ncbi:MAG: elongation factor G [Gemmatimonadales bacterium]|nr:elongation factor G [Gemmatimonadales bacterium]NIN11068.1 elongation factor G [Gemmatimonadales bacterium]NIN49665.1 elongation factor G [Gemmatimonadales bacterium]NIP07129.1 elongation factor G [Gemmatimonadales bacterium]NIQ99520.1 elongation factor G [Gemmatimonadales bacterium]
MKVYKGDAIRNVAVVGHGASGKTSLVDALAFVAGSSSRHGSVQDGTALTDHTPDEIERQYSINLALAHAEWNGVKINLIDTPGYLDFIGDAVAGIYAADAALIVVSATAGVEVGTEKVWEYATERGIPRLFFLSLEDKENADFEKVFQDIKAHLTSKVIPIEIPIGEGPEFRGIINLFSRKCHVYKKGTKTGEYDEEEAPEEYQERLERYSQELIETIATTNDELLERYLGGEEISREEAITAMKDGMARGELCPLLCGSAQLTYGVRGVLTKLVELVPPPSERPALRGETWGEVKPIDVSAVDDAPFVAQVFKTVSEPHVGDVSFFRIYSGAVSNGAVVFNAPRGSAEKLNHLSVTQGKDRAEAPLLHAGDIGVVAKLKDTHTNDTLSTQGTPVVLSKIPFPDPLTVLSVKVKQRGEEDKLSTGLHKLHEEDPTFRHEYNGELQQTLISGRGERHLEVIVGRLERKFGVHAELGKPRIAYRETFQKKAEGQGRHKKQTGGRGQFGDCWIRISPLARGEGYEFVDQIKGGVIPNKYVPAVDKGIREAARRGTFAGYPTVDFKVECYDGSYHDVDSSEQSFKMAGILAFRNVAPGAHPVLLEPILEVDIWTPEENLGDVMGDLSARRGQILGSEPDNRLAKVRAFVPEAEMYRYATQLHSMTHGRGTFRWTFSTYQEVPPEIAEKVREERRKELEKESGR